MNLLRWPILGFSGATQDEFVRVWDRLYSGFSEDDYQHFIANPPADELGIGRAFEWKNGKKLSKAKLAAVRRITSEPRIDPNAEPDELAEYLTRPGGVVWRVFWLHLSNPLRFPIYDQHVHRAMGFLLGWDEHEIPVYNPAKARVYLESYRPFFAQFAEFDSRQVDRALFSFGRFLKTNYGKAIRWAESPPAQR